MAYTTPDPMKDRDARRARAKLAAAKVPATPPEPKPPMTCPYRGCSGDCHVLRVAFRFGSSCKMNGGVLMLFSDIGQGTIVHGVDIDAPPRDAWLWECDGRMHHRYLTFVGSDEVIHKLPARNASANRWGAAYWNGAYTAKT